MEEISGISAAKAGGKRCGQGMPPVFWCMLLLYGGAAGCAAAAGLRAMAGICLACAVLQGAALVLLHLCRFGAAGLVFSVSVVFGMLAAAGSGDGALTGFWVLPGVLVQMLPYASRGARRLAAGAMAACFAVCVCGFLFVPAPLADMGAGRALTALCMGMPAVAALLFCYACLRGGQAGHRTLNEQLRHDAYYDALTGLCNRRCGEMVLRRLCTKADAPRCCVAMLDVDDFKAINDRFGHMAGDYVLRQVTDAVCRMLRTGDYVFRWGGEEFLFLLRDVDAGRAHGMMDCIRAALETKRLCVRGEPLAVTVTIGVSVLDLHDVRGSIDRCDAKMYDGKRSGKNRVVV